MADRLTGLAWCPNWLGGWWAGRVAVRLAGGLGPRVRTNP